MVDAKMCDEAGRPCNNPDCVGGSCLLRSARRSQAFLMTVGTPEVPVLSHEEDIVSVVQTEGQAFQGTAVSVDSAFVKMDLPEGETVPELPEITEFGIRTAIGAFKAHQEKHPQVKEDLVNHPKHYNNHPSGVECIEITRHMGFNLGNAVKYIWRDGLKDCDVPVQDLKKAVWYINDEIQSREAAAEGTP